MAFIFTCGTHKFSSALQGYEHITARCNRCGNYSAKVVKQWEWFTFCFVPIIPFSLKPKKDVQCHICGNVDGLEYRPDVQNMMEGGPGGAGGGGQGIPLQGGPQQGNQGWNSQPPPQQQQPMMYGANQQPQQQRQQGKQQPQYL